MSVVTDVASLIPTLEQRLDGGAQLAEATALMVDMTDAEIIAILQESVEVSRCADQVRVVAAGIVAERSSRDAGQSGLAVARPQNPDPPAARSDRNDEGRSGARCACGAAAAPSEGERMPRLTRLQTPLSPRVARASAHSAADRGSHGDAVRRDPTRAGGATGARRCPRGR